MSGDFNMQDFMSRKDTGYYDKQGRPVSMIEWAELMKDPDYKIVQQTDGKFFRVSTVLLGLDHGFLRSKVNPGNERPIIFETMVFLQATSERKELRFGHLKIPGYKYHDSVGVQRYSTLAQAKGGHLDMVEKWTGWRGFWRWLKYKVGLEGA